MASIQANSLRRGARVKAQQGSDENLSKVVELNGKYRLFFRSLEDDGFVDIAAAMVPGRSCDYKVCNAVFIPFREGMFERDDYGRVTDTTELAAWSRIARVLHDAECTRKKRATEREAEETATNLGQPVDSVALSKALEAIELDYKGGEAANGDRIYPKLSPFISNVQQKFTTQVLVVPLLTTGDPDFAKAKYASMEISNAKLKQLNSILDDDNYNNRGSNYIEVGYDYIGSSKQEAGRDAKFNGVAKDLSLETRFPAEWTSKGQALVDGMCNGDDAEAIANMMASRNSSLRSTKSVTDIVSSIKKWCGANSAVFASIDFEADASKYAARDFINTGVVKTYDTILSKFEALASQDAEEKKEEDSETQAELNAAAGVVEESVATIQQAAQSSNVNLADDDLGDL